MELNLSDEINTTLYEINFILTKMKDILDLFYLERNELSFLRFSYLSLFKTNISSASISDDYFC